MCRQHACKVAEGQLRSSDGKIESDQRRACGNQRNARTALPNEEGRECGGGDVRKYGRAAERKCGERRTSRTQQIGGKRETENSQRGNFAIRPYRNGESQRKDGECAREGPIHDARQKRACSEQRADHEDGPQQRGRHVRQQCKRHEERESVSRIWNGLRQTMRRFVESERLRSRFACHDGCRGVRISAVCDDPSTAVKCAKIPEQRMTAAQRKRLPAQQ